MNISIDALEKAWQDSPRVEDVGAEPGDTVIEPNGVGGYDVWEFWPGAKPSHHCAVLARTTRPNNEKRIAKALIQGNEENYFSMLRDDIYKVAKFLHRAGFEAPEGNE